MRKRDRLTLDGRTAALRLHDETTRLIHGAADHGGVFFLHDRHGFTRHHQLVNGAFPFDDHAV